jgi:UDP-2,3-diacylglucosamine hydrolase
MNRPPTEPELAGTALAPQTSPLAIICGGGVIPFAVAEAVARRGRRAVLFPVRGWADAARVARFPHHWVAVGQLARFVRLAREEGCYEVVFIGSAVRPPLRAIRLDWLTLRYLLRVMASFRGGDDHLLSGVGRIFEEQGFRLTGAHEVAPEILVPEGAIGARQPSERDQKDITRALALLRATGPFDIGQAVVVADQYVLAIEAAEGTDDMLARIATLRAQGRIPTPVGVGVLVKAPKPGQDRRFDLPTIGPRTVTEVARAGLAGLAIVAGHTIIAEPAVVAQAAGEAGVFVIGIPDDRPER